jgi:hypothetical protein
VVGEQRQFGKGSEMLLSGVFDTKTQFLDMVNNIVGGFPPLDSNLSGLLQIYQLLYTFCRYVYVITVIVNNILNLSRKLVRINNKKYENIRIYQITHYFITALISYITPFAPFALGFAIIHSPAFDNFFGFSDVTADLRPLYPPDGNIALAIFCPFTVYVLQ